MNRLTSDLLPPIKDGREDNSPKTLCLEGTEKKNENNSHGNRSKSQDCLAKVNEKSAEDTTEDTTNSGDDILARKLVRSQVESHSGRKVESTDVLKQLCLNNLVKIPAIDHKPVHSQSYFLKAPMHGVACANRHQRNKRFANKYAKGKCADAPVTIDKNNATCSSDNINETQFHDKAHMKDQNQISFTPPPIKNRDIFLSPKWHRFFSKCDDPFSKISRTDRISPSDRNYLSTGLYADKSLNAFSRTPVTGGTPIIGEDQPDDRLHVSWKGFRAGVKLSSKKKCSVNEKSNGLFHPLRTGREDPCLDRSSFSRLIVNNQDITHKYLGEWERTRRGAYFDELSDYLEQKVPHVSPSSSTSSVSMDDLTTNVLPSAEQLVTVRYPSSEVSGKDHQQCPGDRLYQSSQKNLNKSESFSITHGVEGCNEARDIDGRISSSSLAQRQVGNYTTQSTEMYQMQTEARGKDASPLNAVSLGKEISTVADGLLHTCSSHTSPVQQSDRAKVKSVRTKLDGLQTPDPTYAPACVIKRHKGKQHSIRKTQPIMKGNPMFVLDFIDGWSIAEKQNQQYESIPISSEHLHPVDSLHSFLSTPTLFRQPEEQGAQSKEDPVLDIQTKEGMEKRESVIQKLRKRAEEFESAAAKFSYESLHRNKSDIDQDRSIRNNSQLRSKIKVPSQHRTRKIRREKLSRLRPLESYRNPTEMIRMRLSKSNDRVRKLEEACKMSKRLLGQTGRYAITRNSFSDYASSINLTEKLAQQLRDLGKDQSKNVASLCDGYRSYTGSYPIRERLQTDRRDISLSGILPHLDGREYSASLLTEQKPKAENEPPVPACENLALLPRIPFSNYQNSSYKEKPVEIQEKNDKPAVLKLTSRNSAVMQLPPIPVKQIYKGDRPDSSNCPENLKNTELVSCARNVPLRVECLSSPYLFDQGDPNSLYLNASSLPNWNTETGGALEKNPQNENQPRTAFNLPPVSCYNINSSSKDKYSDCSQRSDLACKIQPKYIQCLQGKGVGMPTLHPENMSKLSTNSGYCHANAEDPNKRFSPTAPRTSPKTEELSFSFMNHKIKVTFSCSMATTKNTETNDKESCNSVYAKGVRTERRENPTAKETRIYPKKKSVLAQLTNDLEKSTRTCSPNSSAYLEFCKRRAHMRREKESRRADVLMRIASDITDPRKSVSKPISRNHSTPTFPIKKPKSKSKERDESKTLTGKPTELGVKGDGYAIEQVEPESVFKKRVHQKIQIETLNMLQKSEKKSFKSCLNVHIPTAEKWPNK